MKCVCMYIFKTLAEKPRFLPVQPKLLAPALCPLPVVSQRPIEDASQVNAILQNSLDLQAAKQ